VACLDVADGRVVKGTNFVNIRDSGDPVELAKRYSDQGADEIVFLDIAATHESRPTLLDIVSKVARQVFVPLTVGGGVRCVEDAGRLFNAGADKVGVNSAAVRRPELLTELSNAYGVQATVLAIDAKRGEDGWIVYLTGGREATQLDATVWAKTGQDAGAGEILLTSMDADGMRHGFDLDLVNAVCAVTTIPVVASGGAGSAQHFVDLFKNTEAGAGLAASIFHQRSTSISSIKEALCSADIVVRPT
jgi:cyclase